MFLVYSKCDVDVWLKKTYLDIFVVLGDVWRLEFTFTAKVSQSRWKKSIAQMVFRLFLQNNVTLCFAHDAVSQ